MSYITFSAGNMTAPPMNITNALKIPRIHAPMSPGKIADNPTNALPAIPKAIAAIKKFIISLSLMFRIPTIIPNTTNNASSIGSDPITPSITAKIIPRMNR